MPTIRKSSRVFWFIVSPVFLLIIVIGLNNYFQENPVIVTREVEVTREIPVTVEVEVTRVVVVTPTTKAVIEEELTVNEGGVEDVEIPPLWFWIVLVIVALLLMIVVNAVLS